jgi:hypothetical protein
MRASMIDLFVAYKPSFCTSRPSSGTIGRRNHHHDHAASECPATLMAINSKKHSPQRLLPASFVDAIPTSLYEIRGG